MSSVSIKTFTARKFHRCSWCSKSIKIGEKYQNETLFNEDGIFKYKFHMNCVEIAHYVNDNEEKFYDRGDFSEMEIGEIMRNILRK